MKVIQELFPVSYKIVQAINAQGGRAFLVGGAVRDLMLNLPIKDLDIEVHGLEPERLEAVLREFGPVSLVGKLFGVFRVHGLDIDWSLPRCDSFGRKPEVVVDPHMSVEVAARRRDLTMNAMAIDSMTEELIDPFNGMEDIKNKILRTPDRNFFVQDPLRFYRVMQFVGRFEMEPDDELNAVCKTMNINTVSRERIEDEFKKLLLQSRRPSLGLRWIKQLGRLSQVLPELESTVGVAQSPRWHPEGDVFEHSMQTLDAAALIVKTYDSESKQLVLLYSALCHDIGKSITTCDTEDEIKSFGHEEAGASLCKQMMKRITHNVDLIDGVSALVRNHMIPMQLVASKASLAAYKRLARKITPHATLRMLADLCLADKRGRNPVSHEPLTDSYPDIELFIKKSNEAQVIESVEEPVLQGKDLLDVIKPGPHMGELLKKAYEIQIEEGIREKEVLKKRIVGLKNN